jgi:hypothetical protein
LERNKILGTFLERHWGQVYYSEFVPYLEYEVNQVYCYRGFVSYPEPEVNTVIAWMRSKFSGDWSNEYEVIISLPKPCQNVYSAQTVTDDLLGGNFCYLFFYRQFAELFAEMSIEGFAALGLQKLSGVVAEAVELYRKNLQVFHHYWNYDERIDGFLALCKDSDIFDELDKMFCEEFASNRVYYGKYIRQNADCFRD